MGEVETMSPTLSITIDRVVLEGISPMHWRAIESGIRGEFERSLREEELAVDSLRDLDLSGIDAGSVDFSSSTPPRTIGVRIARAMLEEVR